MKFTTIQTRINLMLLITGLIFLLLLYMLYRTTENQEKLILSESQIQFQNEVNSLIDTKTETLKQVAKDYFFWDDFSLSIIKNDTAWFNNNISTILKSFRADYVCVYDSSFNLVHEAFVPSIHIHAIISRETLKKLREKRFLSFFQNTSEGLFEISSASVHPDDDLTHMVPNPNGYLFIGRNWDQDFLNGESNLSSAQASLVISTDQGGKFDAYTTSASVPLYDWNRKEIAHVAFKRSSNLLKLYRHISFYMFLTMLISILIAWLMIGVTTRIWMTIPLRQIRKILETENGNDRLIGDLKNSPGEFRQIGTLFSDFVDQKKELQRAKEKAEESDLLKSAFLANMSHEIRTPMNGILGFVELLKEPKLTGEEQKEFIKIIEESGKRMLNIINDIISISKVEAGQTEVVQSDTNINDQIKYIYTFFKPEAENKGVELLYKTGLSDEDSSMRTDREKVYAIFTNLVKNALKFTDKGSIELGYVRKGKMLEFYVKDTGVGIRQSQQEIIFERFRQASESLARNFEGAGLGLAITKAYVKMLGGNIWVESEYGKGSTFYFNIPYQPHFAERKNSNSIILEKLEDLNIRKLKVLIAEDDNVSNFYLTRLIHSYGKEIIRVKSGLDAVEACRTHMNIDLILMDVHMPVMDGYEATRIIRTFNQQVIIFAQTALNLKGERDKAILAGCNDFLSKPISINEFTLLVKKYFELQE